MAEYTPMMKQYLEVKANLEDALVFYRLGDFYEMFFEDAKIASKELDLVLTGRNAGQDEKVPMCGIPFHAVNSYLPKLVNRGYKVAIVEQLEDPSSAKGIVKRDVIRIVTPGTIMGDDILEKESICICAIHDYGYGWALSINDMSTGETTCLTLEHKLPELRAALLKNNVKEVVVKDNLDVSIVNSIKDLNIVISICNISNLDARYHDLYENIDDTRIIESYGMLINYLESTQKRMIDHLQPIIIENKDEYLKMDYNTILNLELVNPLRSESKGDTLWSFMDRCQSAMGARLLRKMIEKPLYNVESINQRLDQVTVLKNNIIAMQDLKKSLSNIYDLQRLIAKLATKTSSPNDCVRLLKTLDEVPVIQGILRDFNEFSELIDFDDCQDLNDILKRAIVDNPPSTFKDGGIFKKGYDAELDELIEISKGGKNWIIGQENKEKERTGIKTLRIGYNRVFGYYIEVSKGQIDQIKEEYGYVRKQTLANQERYITQELKEKEDEILHAEEKAIRKELALYDELVNKIKEYLFKLQKIGNRLAYIDCLCSLALLASEYGYVRPTFNETQLNIVDGRHPILDNMMKKTKYVSNSCLMDNDDVIIITGPNMGGKSTYMRQIALIVIMAQVGSYVPCTSLKLPLFDQIFTRIGASDDILSGQSTFMVEMNEANNALMNATDKSLIIFDEIGRGTSTYDGMSLAQAMIEYIASCIKAKTLFSTHYHELTSLQDSFDNIKNYHVLVHEENDHVTFMYKVSKGKADKSYGINVARLAHLPESVLNRAKDLLKDLENDSKVIQQSFGYVEMVKEDPKDSLIVEKLKLVDVNNLTPLEALTLVNELKKDI